MSASPTFIHCEVYETQGGRRTRVIAATASKRERGQSDRRAFKFILARAAEQVPPEPDAEQPHGD